MIDERTISTATADAITDDDLATYIEIRTAHPGLDWTGHDNRAAHARRRLEKIAAEPRHLTLELMPVPFRIAR